MNAMGYLLVWIELFVVGLFTVALCVAAISRLHLRWLRWLVGIAVALVPLAATAVIFDQRHSIVHFYDYLLSLTFAISAAGIAVVIVGLKRSAGKPAPVARSWRIGRLAVIWALLLGLHMMTVANMDTAVQSAIAAWTSEAGTVALNVAPARIPDHQNAALVYQKAFESLSEPAMLSDIGGEGAAFEKNVQAKVDSVRQALEGQQVALGLVRRAAAMPDCRFDRDYARPSIAMLLPELQSMRAAARLLAYDARVKLVDRQLRGAFEDVSAMFSMARHAGSDSLLITEMVAIAIHRHACQTLQVLLNTAQPTTDDLQTMRIDDVVSFRMLLSRGLLMEEAFGLSAFSELNEAMPDYVPARLLASPLGPYFRIFSMSREIDQYRTGMARFRSLAQRPYHESGPELERMTDWPGIFIRLLSPAISSVSRATVRGDADQALALAGLAAARYKAAKGHLPAAIADLTPEFVQVPLIDPYDGKPIKMTTKENEIVFYCIGPDREDQQGAAFDEEKETGDISFRMHITVTP